jgi:flagellar protein FlbD
MITLQRLGHAGDSFQLNPDLIVSVESTPDTVITLATSAKVVVANTPEQVSEAVRQWRAQVLATALHDRSTPADRAPAGPLRALVAEPSRGAPAGRPALAAIGGGGH